MCVTELKDGWKTPMDTRMNVNFPEILYVEHALDKRIAYLEGNEEEYDEMKDVLQIFYSENAEEEE